MTQHIEETIKDQGLPVNSRAMIQRLIDLLEEHGTNCLETERARNDARVKAVLWLINGQVFGQVATIDMCNLWSELKDQV